MHFKNFILTLLIGLLLSACTTKEYTKQESMFIVFKTPKFKHADLGFMYENSDEIKIEIYGSGHALMSLTVSENTVCMSRLECMSKKSFNRQVLSEHYPNDLLDSIFRGKIIFEEKGLVKNSNGFTQNISNSNKYKIVYRVLNKEMSFRDTINDILIKVKRME